MAMLHWQVHRVHLETEMIAGSTQAICIARQLHIRFFSQGLGSAKLFLPGATLLYLLCARSRSALRSHDATLPACHALYLNLPLHRRPDMPYPPELTQR